MGREGFSLIEILIVVVIIGILAGTVAIRGPERINRTKIIATRGQVQAIRTAIKTFELEVGRPPNALEELISEEGSGPYLDEEEVPKDSWGRDFRYWVAGKRIKLCSAGPDGEFDTDDDIFR